MSLTESLVRQISFPFVRQLTVRRKVSSLIYGRVGAKDISGHLYVDLPVGLTERQMADVSKLK